MHIDFKKIRFKNILSYGNKLTELTFSKGLNLIKAQNGSGKSSILDAINFALFGKPFRNIKIQELINKFNGKDLLVDIEFSIGNDNYEIIRGLKPNVFGLKKNGEEVESLSSKKLNQEEIDKLLGINERLFKNIVGIAVTNNKPFLTMSQYDKRTLIESIFNIDVLGDMSKEVKKRNTCDKTEQKIKITELGSCTTSIDEHKNYISKITDYITRFDESNNAQIKALEDNNVEMNSKLIKCNSNIDIGLKKINELEVSSKTFNDDDISSVSKEIGAVEHEISRIKKTLATIGDNKFCPICNSELDEGHAAEHIKQLNQDKNKLENEKLPKLKESEKALLQAKEEFNKTKNLIVQIQSKINEVEFNKKTIEKQIVSNNAEIEKLKNKTCDFSTDEYEQKLKELEENQNTLNTELDTLNHRIDVDTKLIEILGDEGLRMFFFKKLLPILNQRINIYLKKFEMNAELEFNSAMEETIKTGKFEQNYNQFSGGEKARIDIAILLSFFDISKIISNWSCSLLMIDEVLDSGVDSNGTEQFISTLYNVISENDKNIGIYLISHKLAEVQVNWNEVIQVEKKSLFSELKVV